MTGKDDNASVAASVSFANVTKRFGRATALNSLSFSIPHGATCAFIGANGAGKTTSFALIGGFLRRFKGQISLNFKQRGDVSLAAFRAAGGVVGLMPQDVICFEDRSLASQMSLFSKLAGRGNAQASNEVEYLLNATDLMEHRNKVPSELSHGMRVRFGIAQAFVGEPAIVLLDEPTAGLDPLHLAQIRTLLIGFKGRTTLIVSSHDLSELQGWCDYVVMLERGKCIKHGPLGEVVYSTGDATGDATGDTSIWCVRGEYGLPVLSSTFPGLKFTKEADELRIEGQMGTDTLIELLSWFEAQRCTVLSFDRRHSLEQAYLENLQGTVS